VDRKRAHAGATMSTTTDEGANGDSLVNVTRPGYKTLSRSFSDKIPSGPFSPSGVAVDGAGTEGGVDKTPSVLDREARVGLGGPLLPTGRMPGDAGLVKESS
jgi:hypothetical protein